MSMERDNSQFFLNPESRILGDHVPRREYVPTISNPAGSIVRKGLHFGQRKLLLSEVEFLSTLIDAFTIQMESRDLHKDKKKSLKSLSNDSCSAKVSFPEDKAVLVVYAGAANGQHLPFLFTLFPNVKFILIDPAPFCYALQEISKQKNGPVVSLISDLCTAELCSKLYETHHKAFRIILVSDIRSGAPRNMKTNAEHTAVILNDNALQEEWCRALQAEWAMLKFHPPYPAQKNSASPQYDPEDHTPDCIDYLGGACLLGVWAPKSSTEVRLVVHGPFPQPSSVRHQYSCIGHEQQCYFYNCNERYHSDCTAERVIWEKYLSLLRNRKVGSSFSIDSSRLWGSLKSSVLSFSDDVEKLSEAASVALGHRDFLPLSPSFSEHHARWFALVYSIKRLISESVLSDFFKKWKPYMTMDVVEKLVKKYQFSPVVPVNVTVSSLISKSSPSPAQKNESRDCNNSVSKGEEVLSLDFWNFFARGDFSEAYSISRVQWSFFRQLPRLGGCVEQAKKRKRESKMK